MTKRSQSTFLGKGILNASDPEIAGGSVFAAANTVRVDWPIKSN